MAAHLVFIFIKATLRFLLFTHPHSILVILCIHVRLKHTLFSHMFFCPFLTMTSVLYYLILSLPGTKLHTFLAMTSIHYSLFFFFFSLKLNFIQQWKVQLPSFKCLMNGIWQLYQNPLALLHFAWPCNLTKVRSTGTVNVACPVASLFCTVGSE